MRIITAYVLIGAVAVGAMYALTPVADAIYAAFGVPAW